MIVIGGGATGLGVALDAAARGFRTVLFEQHDFGKGTSSRSTKLIHGGVRYLREGDLGLVREALRERGRLRHNARIWSGRACLCFPATGGGSGPSTVSGSGFMNGWPGRPGWAAPVNSIRPRPRLYCPRYVRISCKGG